MSGTEANLYDGDSEKWLLGAMFRDPRLMAQAAHSLEPDDFYLEKHRFVWAAMQTLQKDGKGIDRAAAVAELKKIGVFRSVFQDGDDYICDLAEKGPSAADVGYWIDIIKGHSNKRKLAGFYKKGLGEVADPSKSANECLEAAQEYIFRLSRQSVREEAEHIADTASNTIAFVEDMQRQGKPAGIKTGFHELDRLTGGLRRSELAVIGARPGVGKTSLALGIAINEIGRAHV